MVCLLTDNQTRRAKKGTGEVNNKDMMPRRSPSKQKINTAKTNTTNDNNNDDDDSCSTNNTINSSTNTPCLGGTKARKPAQRSLGDL
jgi:hypothetical protein